MIIVMVIVMVMVMAIVRLRDELSNGTYALRKASFHVSLLVVSLLLPLLLLVLLLCQSPRLPSKRLIWKITGYTFAGCLTAYLELRISSDTTAFRRISACIVAVSMDNFWMLQLGSSVCVSLRRFPLGVSDGAQSTMRQCLCWGLGR